MERGGTESLPRPQRTWRIHILVVLAYTLLALALTWPLVAHFGSHVPGNGVDDPPLTWNLWWVKHALLNRATNPFDCDYLFYPLDINLAFYTLTVLNGLLSIPLQAVFGLVLTSNLLLLSSFILSGYGAFLLIRHLLHNIQYPISNIRSETSKRYWKLGISDWAAFTGGLLYAFASSKLFYAALGQWNIASSQWIPFYVLYLFKVGERPRRWRYPLLAALFLLFQAYAEMTYASFLVLFTALWAAWQLLGSILRTTHHASRITPHASRSRWRLLGTLVVLGLVFALGLTPILAMMVPDLLAERDIFVEGGGFADVFSADLLGFLVPTMHHPLFGSLVARFNFHHTVGQHLFLGYATLALAVLGAVVAWRRPAVKFWALSALTFWLLTLGPTLHVNGHDTGLPLPFALVAQLPFFKGNRYPSRYSVLLVLSLAVLVGFGARWLLGRVASSKSQVTSPSRASGNFLLPTCYLLLATLLLFEHLSIPLPLSDMTVPPVYDEIAAMPGDWTLLDVPVAWRNGFRVTGTEHPIIMFEQYYQSGHHKRLLAGNTSRNPPLKFQYFTEAPVINTLIALETGHTVDPAIAAADQAVAADVLRFLDVRAVVVHPQAGPEVAPYVESVLPVEGFYEDDGTHAYRVDLPPWPAEWTVEPGDALSLLSYAEGWGEPSGGVIWAQRQAARLLLPANGQAQRLSFRAYAPADGQQLRIEANGRNVARLDLAAGWLDYEVALAAEMVREGLNEVWLHFETLVPAEEVQLSSWAIADTGSSGELSRTVESPVNLVVQSAGQEVGNFGHIFVDGVDVSPGERGYNLAVIHPVSGEVVAAAAFDTHLDPGASRALAAFLGDVPPGHIVAVAAADEASRLLGEEAVAALRTLGARGDLRERFRWGHAIVGVKGAAPGAALEALDWMRPVTLVVGEGATEPGLAAALATIRLTAIPTTP